MKFKVGDRVVFIREGGNAYGCIYIIKGTSTFSMPDGSTMYDLGNYWTNERYLETPEIFHSPLYKALT
jgi:hypothetical protein